MQNGALTAVGTGDDVVTAAEHHKALERIQRLERMLGRETEKNEILMEVICKKNMKVRVQVQKRTKALHKTY